MERKIVTIREDQSEWIEKEGIDLSRLVRETIDEKMRPTDEELAEAYRANVDQASETTDEWASVSREATDYLGEAPRDK
jgi:hypothetical protein